MMNVSKEHKPPTTRLKQLGALSVFSNEIIDYICGAMLHVDLLNFMKAVGHDTCGICPGPLCFSEISELYPDDYYYVAYPSSMVVYRGDGVVVSTPGFDREKTNRLCEVINKYPTFFQFYVLVIGASASIYLETTEKGEVALDKGLEDDLSYEFITDNLITGGVYDAYTLESNLIRYSTSFRE